MKEKKGINRMKGIVLSLIALVGLAACSSSTADKKLPKEESAFTWWADQKKMFGENDYSLTQAELKTDLTDKFNLKLLPSYKKLEELIEQEFAQPGLTVSEPTYNIISTETELIVSRTFSVKEGEELIIYGELKESYTYLPNLNKVKVGAQKLELQYTKARDTYQGKDFSVFMEKLATLLQVPENSVKRMQEKLVEPEKLSGQELIIYEDYEEGSKQRTFGKWLKVNFGSDGLPNKLYAYTMDYRE